MVSITKKLDQVVEKTKESFELVKKDIRNIEDALSKISINQKTLFDEAAKVMEEIEQLKIQHGVVFHMTQEKQNEANAKKKRNKKIRR